MARTLLKILDHPCGYPCRWRTSITHPSPIKSGPPLLPTVLHQGWRNVKACLGLCNESSSHLSKGISEYERGQFLEQMGIAASLAASSSRMRGAISKFAGIAVKVARWRFLTKASA